MESKGQPNVHGVPQEIDAPALAQLYRSQATSKVFGPQSSVEIHKESGLDWYYRGFFKVLLACFLLLGLAWASGRILASLSLSQ
jgi:hypothetical protein